MSLIYCCFRPCRAAEPTVGLLLTPDHWPYTHCWSKSRQELGSVADLYENGIECSFLLAWRGLNVLSFFRWKGIFLILTPSPHRLPHRPSNPPPSTALSFPLTLIEVNDVSRGRRQGRRARSLKSHHLAWSATYTTKTWGVLEMCSPSIFLRAACHGQCSWRRQEGQTNTCTSVTALTGEIKGWQDWNLACPPPTSRTRGLFSSQSRLGKSEKIN